MDEKMRKQIEEYAKSFKWTPKDFYWNHNLQVREFALLLQEKVGGDRDVCEASALLHDIGKAKLRAPGHEKISAQLAKQFLEKIRFDKTKTDKVVEGIKYENFKSIEARILRSADSMSLLMDNSEGREGYFKNILKNNKEQILKEIKQSYQEISFDFAKKFVEPTYKKLLEKYE